MVEHIIQVLCIVGVDSLEPSTSRLSDLSVDVLEQKDRHTNIYPDLSGFTGDRISELKSCQRLFYAAKYIFEQRRWPLTLHETRSFPKGQG